MKFYNFYVNRHRFNIGIRLKKYQALKIFSLFKSTKENTQIDVLEFGPGDGYITQLSIKAGYNYTAVEASPSIAEKLKSSGINVINCFVPPIPHSIGKFDVCFVLHLIEHLKDIDIAMELFESLKDNLKEDGKLIVACPDFMYSKEFFYDCDYTHSLVFTGRKLKQLFNELDYSTEEYLLYSGMVFSRFAVPFFWLVRFVLPKFLVNFIYDVLGVDAIKRLYYTFTPNSLIMLKKK